MNSNSSKRGGKLPVLMYLRLRQFHARIQELEQDLTISGAQRAAQLGIAQSSYRSLAKMYHQIPYSAWQAAASGDWSLVEQKIFGTGWGDITRYPSYKRAFGGNQSVPKKKHARRAKRPRKGFVRKFFMWIVSLIT